jgi:flagellar assembly factor FliW
MPAFEEDLEFRLVARPDWRPFAALESLRPGGPKFICIDIQALLPEFEINLNDEELGLIGCPPGAAGCEKSLLMTLAVVTELDDGTLTANLAAPVVLNRQARAGIQSIQHSSGYSPFTVIRPGQERRAC